MNSQHQDEIRNEINKLLFELSPKPDSDDEHLFDVRPYKPLKKRAMEYSQYIDENQMKRTRFVSNMKNVDTLCSLLFSDDD